MRAWGCRSVLVAFFFFLCAWLEAGLVPHYWACFSPLQVCPGTHTLVGGLHSWASFTPCWMYTLMHTLPMATGRSTVRVSALFLWSIRTVVGNGSLHFSGEHSWSKRSYSRMAGEWLEWAWHMASAPGSSQSAAFTLWHGASKFFHTVFKKNLSFSQPLGYSH